MNVLEVMDADGRGIALLCDFTVSKVQESWKAHLIEHDKARAVVAELIAIARTIENKLNDSHAVVTGIDAANLSKALAKASP